MPRVGRVIIPKIAHHIVQRGNNRQNVLENENDFTSYCYWINKYSLKYNVSILAYCLMSNHVHFVIIPEDKAGLSKFFQTVHMRYAQYINEKRQTSGHIWQGRFFSCVLDDAHLFQAIRYVEQNPVRANMVKYPWEYEWSSARCHVNIPGSKHIRIEEIEIIDKDHWRDYILNREKSSDEELRKTTNKGKAFACDDFIKYWERNMNCTLRDLKRGRKNRALSPIFPLHSNKTIV